jgi:GNAT superfamily N-acetyltransferase
VTEIRMADEHDEFEIFKLCAMMHEEQPYHPLSWDKVVPMVHLATRRERGIIGVIGDRHDLKAAIFLLIDPIWYSDEWQLMEFFNYVRPDARKTRYAADLINFAKKCADDLGLDLTVGVFSNIRTEAKIRLYSRLVPKMGAFFCYSPPSRPSFEQRLLDVMEPANAVAAE